MNLITQYNLLSFEGMDIKSQFTEEQKVEFFRRSGFSVETREYNRHVRYTHGWWELEYYEAKSVKVQGVWYKIDDIFDRVMEEKLVAILLRGEVQTNKFLIMKTVEECKKQ